MTDFAERPSLSSDEPVELLPLLLLVLADESLREEEDDEDVAKIGLIEPTDNPYPLD